MIKPSKAKYRFISPIPVYALLLSGMLLLSGYQLNAQSIQRYTISSVGGIASTCDFQLAFTGGEIAVTTESNGNLELRQGFRVLDTVVDNQVKILSEDNQKLCSGETVQLAATNAPVGQTGTWSASSPGVSFSPSPNDPEATASGIPTGDAFLIWTVTKTGCPAVSDSISVSNLGLISKAGPDTTLCGNESVTLGDPNSNGNSYSWSPTIGLSNSNIKQPVASPNATTTYFLTVSQDTCSVIDTVTLTVSDGPSVTPNIITEDESVVCSDDGFTLAANNPPAGEVGTWTASIATVTFSPDANTPNATVNNLPENQDIILKWEIDKDGCASGQADSITVLNKGGLTSAIINSGDTTLCQDATLSLTASQPGTGETGTWTSSGGIVILPSPNSPNITISNIPENLAELTWTISVLDNTCPPSSQSIQVNSTNPQIDLGDDTGICAGEELPLDGGDPDLDYLWSTGSTEQIIIVTQPGVYSVRGSVSANCFAEDEIIVTEKENLDVSIADTAICNDQPALLTVDYPDAQSYAWNTGGSGQSISVNQAGTYSVDVTSKEGCSGTASITISTDQYDVGVSPTDTVIKAGGTVQIIAFGGDTYNWTPVRWLSCINCASPVASPDSSLIYTVKISRASGCWEEEEVRIRIGDEDSPKDILVFPNIITPNGDSNNDSWVIQNLDLFQQNEMVIYDRWGAEVFRESGFQSGWTGRDNSGKDLPSGTYFFMLELITSKGAISCPGEITILR